MPVIINLIVFDIIAAGIFISYNFSYQLQSIQNHINKAVLKINVILSVRHIVAASGYQRNIFFRVLKKHAIFNPCYVTDNLQIHCRV
jgi:hypothetical protein